MYNVSVGPSKIMAKTRRGMNQNMERMDSLRDNKKHVDTDSNIVNGSGPKPIFHTSHGKSGNNRQQEAISPEHEELVRFVSEVWNDVRRDYEDNVRNNTTGPDTVVYYEEKVPNKLLEDFKPFDLESWWGKRLFNNITKSVP